MSDDQTAANPAPTYKPLTINGASDQGQVKLAGVALMGIVTLFCVATGISDHHRSAASHFAALDEASRKPGMCISYDAKGNIEHVWKQRAPACMKLGWTMMVPGTTVTTQALTADGGIRLPVPMCFSEDAHSGI